MVGKLQKTRRRTRDLDQIAHTISSPHNLASHLSTFHPDDLPAAGLHHCAPCSKFFESHQSLTHHQRSKPHKKRLRKLRDVPYTQTEAEAAIGRGVDSGIVKVRPEDVIRKASRDQKVLKTFVERELDDVVEIEMQEREGGVEDGHLQQEPVEEVDEDLWISLSIFCTGGNIVGTMYWSFGVHRDVKWSYI